MPDLWKYYRVQSDTDAETFFAACVTAGTTLSAGQKTAIYNLVGGLKWASLWTKMTALYPFIGGTAATHAINLKSPGTYNIQNAANATWTGMTHNSTGITGSGGSQYGDTGINANTVLSLNSCHLSVYTRTNSTGNLVDIGSASTGPTKGAYIYTSYTGGLLDCLLGAASDDTVSVSDSARMSICSRTSASLFKLYKNGSLLKSTTTASTSLPSLNIYIAALNLNGSPSTPSTRNLSFASVGSGLTNSEAQYLSSIVQSYQTALGRAV